MSAPIIKQETQHCGICGGDILPCRGSWGWFHTQPAYIRKNFGKNAHHAKPEPVMFS